MSREGNWEKVTTPESTKEDKILDPMLRPRKWDGFIGQARIKKNLKIIIEASKKRKEPCCEHLLFYGNSGLGKTSLSHLVAQELNANIRITSGTVIKNVGDLAAILSNLSEGEVLFIDEIHRLYKLIEEFLYSAMEDYKLHLVLGKGPMAKTMELDLPKFTLIGATTKIALLSSPLRNRFGAVFQLNFYNNKEIVQIIKNSAEILKVEITPKALKIIAKKSRFTPRVANRLLKRMRDWAQVEAKGIITESVAKRASEFLSIDEKGLGEEDRKILRTIIEKFEGGPVGLQAIAAASSEEETAVLDVYEPYLMQLGFIKRTSQGRVVTKLAYEHLGITPKTQKRLM